MNEPIEVTKERNEKNNTFRKRLKNTYIGIYSLPCIGLLLMISLSPYMGTKPGAYIVSAVLITILFAWLLWLLIRVPNIRCPHCNQFIGRSDPWNIPKCPYCGTSLEILKFSEDNQIFYKE